MLSYSNYIFLSYDFAAFWNFIAVVVFAAEYDSFILFTGTEIFKCILYFKTD